MLLAEAVISLRRAVKRRYGSGATVRLVPVSSKEFQTSPWVGQGPLPLIIINGKLFSQGTFSFKAVIAELKRLAQTGK